MKLRIKLLVVSVCIGLVYSAGVLTANSTQPVITYLDSPPIETVKEVIIETEKKVEVDSSMVKQQLDLMWELTTVRYNYSGACSFESSKLLNNWTVPFTTKFFIFTYDGYIKAGVDLSTAEVVVQDDTAYVTVSSPEVFDNVILEDSIRVIDESKNILNPIQILDLTTVLTQEKDKMMTRAINNGLMAQARVNADLVIKSVVQQLQLKCVIAYK